VRPPTNKFSAEQPHLEYIPNNTYGYLEVKSTLDNVKRLKIRPTRYWNELLVKDVPNDILYSLSDFYPLLQYGKIHSHSVSIRCRLDERTKFDNVVVQYKRTMAYLREILNHTFLRAVYHTSSRQARLEYQEAQRNFINDHSDDDPEDEPVKFTALNIIEYIIEEDCICSNDKALQSITNTMCERYELKIDYITMDQVCTWSQY
jgi:hypothetical protein